MTIRPRAAIVGVAGLRLTAEEVALFRAAPPLGAILFARNVDDPDQLRALTAELRDLLGAEAPILVDQEGGRVARLRPPHWPEFAAAAAFTGGPTGAARANAALLGQACAEVGFDVVCAPVLDLRLPGAHDIIGDRSFGTVQPRSPGSASPLPRACRRRAASPSSSTSPAMAVPWWTAIWTCRGSRWGLRNWRSTARPSPRWPMQGPGR